MRKRMMEKLRKISTMYYLRQIVACLLVYCILLALPMQVALADPDPTNGIGPSGWSTTTPGAGVIPGADTTLVIAPNESIFNWDNFDIGFGHTVTNLQSLNTDSVLHRVDALDGLATGINGRLEALGNLFVVNPRGIVIGADAFISANRFIASGLNISDPDFLGFIRGTTSGELRFQGYDEGTLGVELKEGGQITADTVGLIGKTVVNAGIITSDTVVLAAGQKVYLTATDIGGKIFVEVADLVTPNPGEHTVTNNDTATITAPGGDVLLAAGDIYSAAITGVGKLAAVANGDIHLNGDFEAGEMTLTADYDGVGGGNVFASGTTGTSGTLTSTTGNIEISASDNTIHLNVDIDAAEDLLLNNNTEVTPDKTLKAGQDVILADDKTMNGAGVLTVEANRDIVLGGAVTAVGTLTLKADADLQYGGDVTAKGAITAGGNVDIAGNLIELKEDVRANGGDLTITGRTSEGILEFREESINGPEGYWGYIDAEGKTLYASHDVFLIDAFGSGGDDEPPAGKMDLFGHGSLEIEAKGGEITTEGPWGPDGVTITVQDLSPASLTMKQAAPLNLVDYTFGNQENTDLTLESYNGSVTAVDSSQESQQLSGKNENAADQWLSITAAAYTDITLQGHDASRDIKAKALTSNATAFDVGNISVTSDNSKVLLTEDVRAFQGSISITAVDPDNGGIISSGDIIRASDGITLFGEVTADKTGLQIFDARQGTLWAKDTLSTITKTGTGGLTLAGDTLVNLDGVDESSGDSVWVKGGPLTIDGPVDAEGNLRASDVIRITGPANLAGDVISTGSGITYEQAVTADGDTSQRFDAGSDKLWAWENITKTNVGNLTLAGSVVDIDDLSGTGTSLSVTSGGSLTIEDPAEIDSDVSAEGITFNGAVTADGDTSQRFDAGSDKLWAWENITKTNTGNLTLAGSLVDIDDLSGTGTSLSVTSGGSLTIEDPAEIDSDVSAECITFNGAVTADGDTSQRFDAGSGTLLADENITKTNTGNLTLAGSLVDIDDLSGTGTSLSVTSGGSLTIEDPAEIDSDVSAEGITFNGAVTADGDMSQRFDAGSGTLLADENITKTGTGNLTLAGSLVDIDDLSGTGTSLSVTSGGSLTIEDPAEIDSDVSAEGITFNGAVTADGDMSQRFDAGSGTLLADENITKTGTGNLTLAGSLVDIDDLSGAGTSVSVTSGGSLTIEDPAEIDSDVSAEGITFNGTVTADGDTSQRFDAGSGTLGADGNIEKTTAGNLNLAGDAGIVLGGNVLGTGGFGAGDTITFENDVTANGGSQILDAGFGTLDADGHITKTTSGSLNLGGEAGILLGGDVSTGTNGDGFFNDLIFEDAVTANGTGVNKDQTFIAGPLASNVGSNLIAYSTITKEDGGDPDIDLDGGNLTLRGGWQVNISGDVVVEDGKLTVEADSDIELRGNVSSFGKMTMDAGSDIRLNEDSGNTSSDSTIALTAGDDVTIGKLLGDEGNVTANGNMNITAGGDSDDDVKVFGKLTTTNGGYIDVRAGDDVTILGTWNDDIPSVYESAEADGTLTLTANTSGNGSSGGNLRVAGSVQGNMELSGTNVTVGGDVTSLGTLDVDADNNIRLKKNVSSENAMTMNADKDIRLNQDGGETVSDSTVTLIAGRDVKVEGNLTTTGNNDVGNTLVEADRNIKFGGNVNVDGHLEAYSGLADYFGAGSIEAYGSVIAASMQLEAGAGLPDYSDSRVQVDGLLQTTGGDMVVRAHHDILLGGNVVSAGDLVLNADRHGDYGYPEPHIEGGDVDVKGTVDAVGTIDMYGNNIMLDDDVTSGGNMTLTANTSQDFNFQPGDPEGDVVAMGNLTSNGDSIEISSDDSTTYLGGDVTAAVNVTLNNNTVFNAIDDLTTPDVDEADQTVDAQTGKITANGWLWKNSPWGSLYLEAAGDVSLDDYVTADAGGVSIISENGKIFTPDENGEETDTLNVAISGTSDQRIDAGVKLNPDMDNKAAIVIKSKEDLKLGEGVVLTASGLYGGVDDRAAMGLLDDGDPATATIGGVLRDEGEPFDVAIYLASTGGDVDVSGPVTITSYNMDSQTRGLTIENSVPRYVHQGAMVIDAWDTVTFDGGVPGGLFETSLENGDVGDRLEVVSRITEWLFQAVGRLPYPYGGLHFPLDYTYVLRGAGLDNPAIAATTDDRGRAWVLEDPLNPAPLHEEAGQAVGPLTLGLEGCPVLVAAVSVELGVPGDTIQVSLANSFALNTNIQPCESCARLLNAATILRDEDGSGMAAMNQVFNTVAPAGAPFTPEMATSIATAFAGRVNDGTQYATAIEYIDAFVRYLAVLDTEMGSPVADGDSIAFIMGKYGTGITESENSNIAAFVATRLESGDTFGE